MDAFVAGLMHSIFSSITHWLADSTNGIVNFFAIIGNFHKVNTDELCLKDVCVNRDQFAALLASQSNASTSSSSSGTNATSSPAAANDPSTTSSQSSDGYGAGNTPTTNASSTPPAVSDNPPPVVTDIQSSSTPQTATMTIATSTAA